MTDVLYAIQQQQLQRCKGELRALLALHYDPMKGATVRYEEVTEIIEKCINDLENTIG